MPVSPFLCFSASLFRIAANRAFDLRKQLILVRALCILEQRCDNLRNIGGLVMFRRGDLLCKILVSRDHRRKPARIFSSGSVVHKGSDKLVRHQIVDDNMKRIFGKERIIRIAERDFHDLCAIQRAACLPQQLHPSQSRTCKTYVRFFALHTTASLFAQTFGYEYYYRPTIIYSIFLFLEFVNMFIRENYPILLRIHANFAQQPLKNKRGEPLFLQKPGPPPVYHIPV